MLTKKEKKLVVHLLKEHLKEARESEFMADEEIKVLAGDKKYEFFVQDIIKKLEQ